MMLSGLRIVLVGPLPPPAGGMANQTRQLAELLAAEGTRVELVQVNAPYRPAWIGRVPAVRAGFRLAPYLARLWRAAGRADLCHVMANSGWSWHLVAAPAIWIASLRRVPVVVNYRGGEAASFLRQSASIVRATMARANALAVPSGFLQRVFAEHGIDSRVVPNIVDVERFHPPATRVPRDPSAPHLVVARNLELIYDVPTAIRALAAIRDSYPRARMSVAGSGPELDTLRALARSLGLERDVKFTGRLDRDQMAEMYRNADLVLNPSRVDNMPNSILEALASGVPVVSTDVGGIPFILTHGKTGLLVPPGDDRAMAEAALSVLRNEGLRAQLTASGIAEAQRYTWQRVRDALVRLYSECVKARSVAATVA